MKKPERNKVSPDGIKHFLVSYDLTTGKTEVESFGTDYDAAQAAYAGAERANADGEKLDIVLLSADSLETIKQTHSSYFDGAGRRLAELLPGWDPGSDVAMKRRPETR